MKNKKKRRRTVFLLAGVMVFVLTLYVFAVNFFVVIRTKGKVYTLEESALLKDADVDCIVVLGAAVLPGGTPSNMLYDRIITGVSLYQSEIAPKIIMSGDHGSEDYNEVGTMKEYAIDAGVPSEDIFMDHAGFSTYESIYRAKEIFQAQKIVIVTQQYHLYRALYVAEQLGIEAYGVAADLRTYAGQIKRDVREVLARNKDFVMAIVKPKPTYLGTVIPVSGNGDATNE